MKRDKLEQWAHEHAEDVEIMYHEHRLVTLADVVKEAEHRRGARRLVCEERSERAGDEL